jgi:hypothetical protein
MSLLGASLFSPDLRTNHPIVITPLVNAGDLRQLSISKTPSTDEADGLQPSSIRGDFTLTGVSSGESPEAYSISWPKIKGAVRYRLYGSMSPVGHGILLQDDIKDVETIFHPPYFSEVVAYFFWVSSVDKDGKETFICEESASLMASNDGKAFAGGTLTKDCKIPGTESLDCMMKDAVEFIRRGNRLQLELNGEPAYLYLRRHAEDRPWGMACSCTDQRNDDDSDPDYQGKGRCKLCFGTGIFGGFFPRINIAIRYGAAPEQLWKWTKRGQELQHGFNTYMLWTPVVRVGDLIIRAVDGSRYTVVKTRPDISVRGVRLHQEFDLQQVEKTDILMEVTDEAIAASMKRANLPKYLREGYRIFG